MVLFEDHVVLIKEQMLLFNISYSKALDLILRPISGEL